MIVYVLLIIAFMVYLWLGICALVIWEPKTYISFACCLFLWPLYIFVKAIFGETIECTKDMLHEATDVFKEIKKRKNRK